MNKPLTGSSESQQIDFTKLAESVRAIWLVSGYLSSVDSYYAVYFDTLASLYELIGTFTAVPRESELEEIRDNLKYKQQLLTATPRMIKEIAERFAADSEQQKLFDSNLRSAPENVAGCFELIPVVRAVNSSRGFIQHCSGTAEIFNLLLSGLEAPGKWAKKQIPGRPPKGSGFALIIGVD